jgi:hypothetical chaperone protein
VLRESAAPGKIERLVAVLEQRRGHELLASVEAAKIALSHATHAAIELDAGIAIEIVRADLDRAVADNLARIQARIGDVLRLAGLAPGAISAVFLTGGATRMPAVRDTIAAAMPNARLVAGDAFGSVATGLALDAAKRFA